MCLQELSLIGDVHANPRRPISAELEIVVEVHETRFLEIIQDVAECGIVRDWADQHELTVDAELVGREIETFDQSTAA